MCMRAVLYTTFGASHICGAQLFLEWISSLTKLCLLQLLYSICSTDAVFCVWRPSEDLRQLLKEGCSYRVYSLQASEGRYSTCVMWVLCINWCAGKVLCFVPKLQYSKSCNSIGPFVVFPWGHEHSLWYIWWRVFSDPSLNVLRTLPTVLPGYSGQTVKTIQAT